MFGVVKEDDNCYKCVKINELILRWRIVEENFGDLENCSNFAVQKQKLQGV